jgi:predicted amidohydrolase YtcJ
MSTILIRNARIWDEEAGTLFDGAAEIRGNRIARVHRKDVAAGDGRGDVIDAGGRTLMPGLVEGHCHPSFVGIATNAELGRIPPEEHTLRSAANVKLLL